LADPRAPDAGARLLGSVQRSEPYLTTRLLVPAERAAEFFDLPPGAEWPLRFAQLRVRATEATGRFAPGAVRGDGTARPQVVHAGEDPELHRLLTAFGEQAGSPLVLHATFKLRGMPMVRTRTDALEAFGRSGLDCLVAADRLYEPAARAGETARAAFAAT
jgi:carbamoyltransferase